MAAFAWLLVACNKTGQETEIAVSSVTITPASQEVALGETVSLQAQVLPDNATDKKISWSSTVPVVATVSQDGVVTALAVGTTTIKATAGGKTGTCAITVVRGFVSVTAVTLDRPYLDLVEGDEATLTARVFPDDATDPAVTWSSSNEQVATVEGGVVKALQEGQATIKASAGGKEATCPVTVTKKYIPVERVTLNKTELALIKDTYEVLTVTIEPEDATYQTPAWTSSNANVATVDEAGRVTARGGGSAVVTATVDGKQATCAVTVTVPVTSITLNYPDLSLVERDTEVLVATITPTDATDKTVAWSTSDATVAQVDAQGKVTALKVGEATITAKAGDKQATCAVTVVKKVIPVSEITLNKTTLNLIKGQSETLAALVSPADATDKTVTWTSSNEQVATVSGGKVTAVGGGNAVITAKAGDKSATCAVTVTVPVTGITLDKTTLTLVEGTSAVLTATVTPADATDPSVTWTSSDPGVATVSDGKVTAIRKGETTLIARAGEEQATCLVKVEKKVIPVSSITLSQSTLTLAKGASETLTATVLPADATDPGVTWTTSNAAVATVDANGKVTAVGGGHATITAKAGDKEATCAVTVVIPVSGITLSQHTLALEKGASATLTATVTPANATDKTVTWSTSDAAVATVDANGKVTAVGGGNATITAKAGDKEATCAVTVNVPVSSLVLNKTTLTLAQGQSEALVATVGPADATETVTWSSSDAKVATVDASGKVTAVGTGNATITAKAGDKEATCAVTVTVPVSSLSLNKNTLSLTEGDSETLIATVNPSDATDKTVTWSTSNAAVATVDADGKVTALTEGTAVITAKAGGKEATCAVTVSNKVVPVTDITLSTSTLSLMKGESATLTATVTPADATDKTVSWTSSDEAVATVDANGKVTAVGGGSAVITAHAGSKSATCSVQVTSLVTGISLNKTELNLAKGASETLTATITPADATEKTVTWTTSNAAVATVDANGKVTATGVGTATITAKAGDQEATCAVKVTIPVSSIILNKESLTLMEGESEILTATVTPADATDKTVTWTSSNPAVASVEGGVVKALQEGTAVITAKAGDKSATCSVTVDKKVIPVSEITLDKTSLSLLKGQSETLTATVGPADATDKTVTWSSSNPAAATVDANGKVTAVGGGTATITAKAGTKTATCEVTVNVSVTGITLNKSTLKLDEGQTFTLVATVLPSDATDKTVTWTSSDPAVATVEGGVVKAIKVGTATITAKAGDKTATCEVTVDVPGHGSGSGGNEDFGNEDQDW